MIFDIPGMASYKLGLAESSPELLEDCSHVAKELEMRSAVSEGAFVALG